MAGYRMLVYTNPVEGRDEEFNHWYNEIHLHDVLQVPGVVAAQRFRLPEGGEHRYLAIYELETEDVDGVMQEMARRSASGEIRPSDAMDRTRMAYVMVAPVGERVEAR